MKKQRLILSAKHRIQRLDCYVSLLLMCFCMVGSHAPAQAQQTPIQTQYFLNPYAYNPAFVGNQGYTEAFLTHRRQWVEMEGAPVATVLSLHLPTRGPMAFGTNLYTTRQGLLNITSGMATAGYTVQLSHNQYLRGGISLGLRSISVDQSLINATDPSDPAFVSNFNNHIGFDANVGLNYQIAGLTLGAAMANPFRKANPLDGRMDKPSINPLDQLMLSSGYRIELDGAVIEPQLLYGTQKGSKPRMEALATVFLRDIVWVGGAYRNGYGPSFFGGVLLAEVARIGYAYELASKQVNGIGRGSHEIMLSYRFGDKKETGPTNGRRRTKGDEFKEKYFRQEQRKVDKANKHKKQEARKAEKRKEELKKQEVAASKAAGGSNNASAQVPASKQAMNTAQTDSVQAPEKGILPGNGQRTGASQAKGAEKDWPTGTKKAQAAPAKTTQPGKNSAKYAPSRSKPGGASKNRVGSDKAVNQPVDAGQPIQPPQAEDQAPTDQNFESLQRTVRASESGRTDEIPKGYYVVVGTFQYKENAQRFTESLAGKGFAESNFKFSSETNYYYVYVLQTQHQEEARKEWMKLRQIPGFEDTWVNVLHVQ